MEVDGRVKRKVVVDNKLETVSSVKSTLHQATDLYIVPIVQVQLWAWELPIGQNDVSRLAVRCSNFPRKIDLEENVSAKRKWYICQKPYSQKRSIGKHC